MTKHDYSIPKEKYCSPACLIVSDLVLREDLATLKKGLGKLLSKHYSHKFLGGVKSQDEIMHIIENMDDTQTWWYDGIEIGRFDFETKKNLKDIISYFDLYVRNINSSYLAIEVHIYFSDNFIKKINQVIDSDIDKPKTYITYSFKHSKKKSGGKTVFSLCNYNEAYQKSDRIFEEMTAVKWLFFSYLQRFFPTCNHVNGRVPPSVLIYKTNINYEDDTYKDFWLSLGLSKVNGQSIDDASKMFFMYELSGRYEKYFTSDMVYLYNEDLIEQERGFYTKDYYVVYKLSSTCLMDILKFNLLNVYNTYYARMVVKYRTKLNKIKLNKNKLHSLLKLRYRFEKEMDSYLRYCDGEHWDDSKEKIDNFFENKDNPVGYKYTYIMSPRNAMDNIKKQINNVVMDFDIKTSVLQHLSNYKNESKNRKINFIMLALTSLTLVFVIFPNWSDVVADWISNLINWIKNLLI